MSEEENEAGSERASSGRLLLVDLCGTLYDSNTTFDFLRFFLSRDAGYRHFESASSRPAHRIINRCLPGDIRRRRAVSFLKGYPRSRLLDAAKTFLASTAAISDVRRYVDQLAGSFDRVVLISSSLDFIVETACDILQFDDFHASRLCYAGQICEGRFDSDLLGAKHRLIAREFAADRCTLITDNAEDARCKKVVSRLIGVARAGDQVRMDFWKRHADEVIAYER